MIKLPSGKVEIAATSIAVITNYSGKCASIKDHNGKQLAFLQHTSDGKSQAKLQELLEELAKHGKIDANYWVELPNSHWLRKNMIYGFERHYGKHRGVIIRGSGNHVISFIPCSDKSMQERIIQELKKAIEVVSPSRRHKPTWDFYTAA